MMAGAVALGIYSLVTGYRLFTRHWSGLPAAIVSYIAWLAVAFGLLAFAVVIWQLSTRMPPWLVLLVALVIWFTVAVFAWWVYRKITT